MQRGFVLYYFDPAALGILRKAKFTEGSGGLCGKRWHFRVRSPGFESRHHDAYSPVLNTGPFEPQPPHP